MSNENKPHPLKEENGNSKAPSLPFSSERGEGALEFLSLKPSFSDHILARKSPSLLGYVGGP
jgi:hypothetical protein